MEKIGLLGELCLDLIGLLALKSMLMTHIVYLNINKTRLDNDQ